MARARTHAVLWVTRDVAAGTCTLTDKCTLAVALTLVSATKNVIHLDPLGYHFTNGFTLVGHFTMTGAGDGTNVASIAVDTGNVFTIASQNFVTIDFLQFGGTAATQPDEGVECTNGTFFARKIGIAFTKGIAINTSGCGFRLERSSIHDAAGGAIEIGGGAVSTLFDNMIFRNGNPTTAGVGGVFFTGSVDPATRFEFNTVVDNVATAGAQSTGGVSCDAAFAGANNIIARNAIGASTTAANAQTFGECTYPTSDVQADVTNLAFASPDAAPFSYKLTAGSVAIDMATTASTVDVDFEGDSRPQGAQDDIGADELEAVTLDYVDIAAARAAAGTRIVTSSIVASPWSEAAKGLFALAKLPALVVARGRDGADVMAWTGVDNVPVVLHEHEPARTNWASIVGLANRLAGPNVLVPVDPVARADVFGLIELVAGEDGLGWNARLAMLHTSIESSGARGFPIAVANYLGGRYGRDATIPSLRERVAAQLGVLTQRLTGGYFAGDRPGALDVYVATFLTAYSSIDEAACPQMIAPLRRAFGAAHEALGDLVPAELWAHRRRMFDQHLPWPIRLS